LEKPSILAHRHNGITTQHNGLASQAQRTPSCHPLRETQNID
jgi:hypothetical protein